MHDFEPPDDPAWFAAVVQEVDHEFAVTGRDTPGWPDPHGEREPSDEEYSRCLDPGKYRILSARVDAWARVLTSRGVTYDDTERTAAWHDAIRSPAEMANGRRFSSTQPSGAALLTATTVVGGEPYGLDLAISHESLAATFVDTVPDCGCDACDSGSADLLYVLDGWFLTVARGGVLRVWSDSASLTRTRDGWEGSGIGAAQLERWLDETVPTPANVGRVIAQPWF
ncbi:DUF6226 family protein [Nocardioides abyssi]|uniref:DUF6226 family protein n=1 Tax=Nocardioides abyssi TaxID=3058370 RepID=A0ABT8ESS8_9ACTN|nr:DUF6226 family protein [Nocardioides abyssi]MDN4161088.1 DUF6226 family protein [Nocardioides abyssi]